MEDFVFEKQLWSELFSKINGNIYLTCHKWDSHPVAAAAAMSERGGISAVFQSSYYEFPCAYALLHTDVYFSFSRKTPSIELEQGSKIKFNICIGNLSQSQNKYYKKDAETLRKQLQTEGAEHIISYFDQDSADDERWGFGHSGARDSYRFLLNKVLENKWLGLIIKPKKPKNLRYALGDVCGILDHAISTGRCYIIENYDEFSPKNYTNPPAQSAMASDIAIQEDMVAGTAGVEARLAGTPTLMMDRYGFMESQFYKMGTGKVVFKDWQSLWERLEKHLRTEHISGFGDWSLIIDDIDPFRDEKAHERMMEFINWLSQGLKDGKTKTESMENAVELYASKWGEDKVFRYKNSD
ncbi:MAG: hypothetical protein HOH13_00390 [Crocinitomicaceae bacterium]|nr:hypothetical protein [Crocinitomicaceae bacterium]